MICLILAGGFAVRMKPLTDNVPKALLTVNGKPILSYIVEDLQKNPETERIIILSNNRFCTMFEKWKEDSGFSAKEIVIHNNGVNSPEENPGILSSIFQVIQHYNISDDFMIVAGDNLLSFSTVHFVRFYFQSKQSSVMWYAEHELSRLQRTGVAIVENEAIAHMQEKPEKPMGNCAIPPLYIYCEKAIGFIRECVKSGCCFDSPGELLQWLVPRISIRVMRMPGVRYDVGNLQDYYALKDDSTKTYFSE